MPFIFLQISKAQQCAKGGGEGKWEGHLVFNFAVLSVAKTRHTPTLGTKPLYGDTPPQGRLPSLPEPPILAEGSDTGSILLTLTQITLALVNLNEMT